MKALTPIPLMGFCSILAAAILGKGAALLGGEGLPTADVMLWFGEMALLVGMVAHPHRRLTNLGVWLLATGSVLYHGYRWMVSAEAPCGCFGAAALTGPQERFLAAMLATTGYLYLALGRRQVSNLVSKIAA